MERSTTLQLPARKHTASEAADASPVDHAPAEAADADRAWSG